MYLTAQRVISSPPYQTGINSFLFEHGNNYFWNSPPPDIFMPENDTGLLVAQHITVDPGGNEVYSYLDIVAPDETEKSTIKLALSTMPSLVGKQPFPLQKVTDSIFVAFNVGDHLLPVWHAEFQQLVEAAMSLLTDRS